MRNKYKVYNKSRSREGPCIQVEMASSVFNSVFSLLARRNQQYKAVTTAVAHRTCAHPSSDYIIINNIIINMLLLLLLLPVKLYKIKYIYYKNQAQLIKAGQQKIIKTNNVS